MTFKSGFVGIGNEGPRPLDIVVQRVLRQMWWAQRRAGRTLPAQRGLIVLTGGKPTNWYHPWKRGN